MAYVLVLTINLPGTFLLGRKPETRAGQGYILGFTFKSVCSPGREKTQINTRLIFENSLGFQALTSALLNPTRRAGEPTRRRISHDSRVVRGSPPNSGRTRVFLSRHGLTSVKIQGTEGWPLPRDRLRRSSPSSELTSRSPWVQGGETPAQRC